MPTMPTPAFITGEAASNNILQAPFDLVSFFFEPWVLTGIVALAIVLGFLYVFYGRLGYGGLGRKYMP